MGHHSVILVLLGTVTFNNCGIIDKFKKSVMPEYRIDVDYLEQCRNRHNLPIECPEMSVKQIDDGQFAFDGIINFTKIVNSPWKITIKIQKCPSKTDARSCQEFFRMSVDKVCDKLADKNQMWSDFVHKIGLDEKKCPIQPEVFHVNDIPIGKNSMKFFPVGEATYRVHIEGHTRKTPIHCFDAQFSLVLA